MSFLFEEVRELKERFSLNYSELSSLVNKGVEHYGHGVLGLDHDSPKRMPAWLLTSPETIEMWTKGEGMPLAVHLDVLTDIAKAYGANDLKFYDSRYRNAKLNYSDRIRRDVFGEDLSKGDSNIS